MNKFLDKEDKKKVINSTNPTIAELEDFFKPEEDNELKRITYTFILKKQKK